MLGRGMRNRTSIYGFGDQGLIVEKKLFLFAWVRFVIHARADFLFKFSTLDTS